MDESIENIERPDAQEKPGGKVYYFFLKCAIVICGLAVVMRVLTPHSPNNNEMWGGAERVVVAEWYSGGNLHGANLAIWSNSTNQNRLATSADFAANLLKGQFSSMNGLKVYALNMKNCIDEVTVEPQLGSQRVSEVAAGCAILLGW